MGDDGLRVSVGPAQVNASGDKAMQAGFFIVICLIFIGGFSLMASDHGQIMASINRLTIATLTSEEDKRAAIGTNLREELKTEVRKAAEQAVKKGQATTP